MLEHHLHRLEQNLNIQHNRPVFDVLAIQGHHLIEIGDLAAAADLPHAGDARLALMRARWWGS